MKPACGYCGKPVNRPACEIRRAQKRGGHIFCGRACHQLWKTTRPVADRFFVKVNKDAPNGCWQWTGSVWHSYGNFLFHGKVWQAHRVSWVLSGRELPAHPLVLDHMCRNQTCVNPDHLRIVTPRVNALENNDSPFARNKRKTHCKYGHPLSGDNVRVHEGKTIRGTPTVNRQCLACYGPGGILKTKAGRNVLGKGASR